MDVFDLVAKLSLDQSEYESGLSDASTKASGFGSGLKIAMGVGAVAVGAVTTAVAGASSAFSKGLKDVASYGDEIDKNSQKLGLSAEGYQKWDYVLNLAGTEMSSMTTGLKTLTNKFDDAVNGSADAQEMFAKLGISMEDMASMSREDLFESAIKGFQQLEDSTERAGLANDLFGKSGQNLAPLFNMTSEELQEAINNTEEYGMVMSDNAVKASAEFKDSITTMQGAFGGLKNSMLAEFLPSVTTVIDGLTEIFGGGSGDGVAMITEGVNGFIDKLSEMIPEISEIGGGIMTALIDAVSSNLDSILTAGADVMGQLADALISNLPTIFDTAGQILMQISEGIITHLPELASVGMEVLVNLANGIASAMPSMIPTIVSVVLQIGQTLIEHLPELIQAGLSIAMGIIQGLIEAIPLITENLPLLIDTVLTTLIDSADLILDGALQMFMAIVDAIPEIVDAVVDALPKIIDSITKFLTGDGLPKVLKGAITMLMAIVQAIPTIVSSLASAIPSIISTLVTFFTKSAPQILSSAIQLFGGLLQAIPTIISKLISSVPQIISSIVKALKGGLSQIVNVGENLMMGLWNGINNKVRWVIDRITGVGKNILSKIASVFEEKSPSKATMRIGEYLAEGLGIGWEEGMDDVYKDIRNDLDYEGSVKVSTSLNDSNITSRGTGISSLTDSDIERILGSLSINLYNTTEIDGKEIKKDSYKYTVQRLGDETRAVKIAMGGY